MSPKLRQTLATYSTSLAAKLLEERSLESCNPVPPYDPAVLAAALQHRLAIGQHVQTLGCNRLQRPDVVFLEGKEPPSGKKAGSSRGIDAVIVIEPTGLKKPEDPKSLDRRVSHVFLADGTTYITPYLGLSLLGDTDFISRCLAHKHLGQLFVAPGPSQYLRLLASSRRAEIDSFHEGLRSDIDAVTTAAQANALDRQVLRSSLMKIVPKQVADKSANRLNTATGPGLIQAIKNITLGSDDPLRDLVMLQRRLDTAQKAFGPDGLLWFVNDHLSQCAMVAFDSEGMWIIQTSAAVGIASSLAQSFPLRGKEGESIEERDLEKLKKGISSRGAIAMDDQPLTSVTTAISKELTGWESAGVVAGILPAAPSRPSPPMRQIGGSSFEDVQKRLERQADRAMARNDIDGFFEAKEAQGAAAAQATGVPELQAAFGASANARARLAGAGDQPRYVALVDDPDYQAALALYERAAGEWQQKRAAVNERVQAAHDKKTRWYAETLRKVHEDEALIKEVRPSEPDESTAFLVPSFRMWIRPTTKP